MIKEKINAKKLFSGIKKTWPYAKKHKKYLIIYCVVTLILISISVIVPLLSAKLILNITDNILKKALTVAIAIFILEVNRNIFNYFSSKMAQLFYINTLNDIQVDLASETLKLDIKEIDKHSSGVFIDRLGKDARNIADVFEMAIYYLMRILENIGILGAIFIVNKTMFIYTILILIFIYSLEKKTYQNMVYL